PAEEVDAVCARVVEALQWQGTVHRVAAIDANGTRELCEKLMTALETRRRRLAEDGALREQEEESSMRMEHEVRESIERARALWRDKRKGAGGGNDDDDDVEV